MPAGNALKSHSRVNPEKAKRTFTALSLFSGAGGLDLGIRNSGFEILAAIEMDPHACNTLRANHGHFGSKTEVIESSVLDVEPAELMKRLGLKKGSLDLLIGGPPCQSFSLIGKQEGIRDERGLLVFQMPRFAAALGPKFVLMEQVKGFLSAKDHHGISGGVRTFLEEEFHKLGYQTTVKVLNAADYGVPQLRKRVFLVASKKGFNFSFPEPTHQPAADWFANNKYTTVGEALAGLGQPEPKGTISAFSHIDVTPNWDRTRISYVKEGEFLAKSNAPSEIKGGLTKKDTTKFLRVGSKSQANTLRCGEIFYHPHEDRYLTPREYMRIHTFPDDYVLTGPIRGRTGQVKNLDQHRQVANSVPPKLAEALGCAIRNQLEKTC